MQAKIKISRKIEFFEFFRHFIEFLENFWVLFDGVPVLQYLKKNRFQRRNLEGEKSVQNGIPIFNSWKHREIEFSQILGWVSVKIVEFREKLSSEPIEFFAKCTKNKPAVVQVELLSLW